MSPQTAPVSPVQDSEGTIPKLPVPVFSLTRPRGLKELIGMKMATRIGQLAPVHRDARGHRMAILANDYIGIHINLFGFYERDELDILFEFLQPLAPEFRAGIALDVGANVGNHSVYFSRRFERVVAFEPNPWTFRLLAFNAESAGNVVAVESALGDEEGVFTLTENPTNVGGSSLASVQKGAAYDVRVQRLDALRMDFAGLAFMKIDVEGFEAQVLRGGERLIREHMPLIVLEQAESAFSDDGESDSILLLKRLGYSFCWHKAGVRPNGPAVIRRLNNLKELLFGREHQIISGERVPRRFHSMLIGVPPRFQAKLGIAESHAA